MEEVFDKTSIRGSWEGGKKTLRYTNMYVELCRGARSWTTGYVHLFQRSHVQTYLGARLVMEVTETS